MNKWLSYNWLKAVAIVVLLGTFSSLSFTYSYYQLMNWLVVGASLVVISQAKKQKQLNVAWLFALVAVIFNPIAPFYLQPDVWQVADAVVIFLFLASFFVIKED